MKKLLIALIVLFGWGYVRMHAQNSVKSFNRIPKSETVQVKIDTLLNFENYKVGILPSDWTQTFTGRGSKTEWKIVKDNGNKVLAQLSSNNPGYHFNLTVYNLIEAKDLILDAKIKGVKGRIDRGGGFVWRYKDRNNYYVVRENPLEDNVVLYKVVNGKRSDLPLVGKGRTYGVDVPRLGEGWNDLKLVVSGNVYTVYLNGKQLFKVKDKTFMNEGKVGFWTKADAVSYFDDFHIVVL